MIVMTFLTSKDLQVKQINIAQEAPLLEGTPGRREPARFAMQHRASAKKYLLGDLKKVLIILGNNYFAFQDLSEHK